MKRKSLLFLLLFALLAPWTANAQETLTVHDQNTATNSNVPVWGLWADNSLQCEMVYPASELENMAGGVISALKFYASSTSTNIGTASASNNWDGTFTIFLKEVEATTLTAFTGTTDATTVLEAQIGVVDGEMTIEFTTPYTYGGGNLLVGVYYATGGHYCSVTWTGISASGASIYGRSGQSFSATQGNFLPKTTFTYTPGAIDCEKPTAIAVSDITTDGATVTWEGEGNAWNLRYKASADDDYTMVENLTTASYTFAGLNSNTTYNVGVQTVCTGSTSFFTSTTFTTANACAAPTNLQVTGITASSATLSWTAGYQETEWTVKYKKSADSWDNATVVPVSGTPTTDLIGLDGLTVYNVRVFNCTGESDPYLTGNFTTAVSFPYSQDFSNSDIPTGWSQYSGLLDDVMAGTATLSSSYWGWTVGTSNGVLDGNNIYANIYSTGCNKWVATPAIPMESGARLTFDVAYTAYSGTAVNPATDGTDDKFVVLISTDNMATWTILRQWDNAGSEFVLNELTPATSHFVFDMADYAGQDVIVAFYAESTVSNTDNNIHVDNVVFELVPSCEKPTNLAVNYTGGITAEVSWEGDATAYNIDVNGTVTNDVTSPYTLSGLELATTYAVKVQAVCGATTSEWTNAVSFSTDMCLAEDMCELTFVLTDSYGDGWNGAYIDVVDVATGISLGHMSNQNVSKATETETYTLAVCDGREIQFVWHSGSFDNECSYVVTDVNGEVIFEGSNAMSAPVNYTVNCTVSTCRKPTDLAVAEIGGHSAKLSWTENGEAEEWIIMVNNNSDYIFTEENPFTLTDLDPETQYKVQVSPVCDVEKWSDEITFTTSVACPVPTATIEPATYSATVTITGEAETYNIRYRTPRGFNYGFEQAEAWAVDDFAPCTTYDGDGDATYYFSNWTFTNQGYTGACIAFNNDNNGSSNMYSHSGNAFGVMFNPVTGAQADDWFILPELEIKNDYVFSFWAREITDQYGAEVINVGVYGSTEGTMATYFAEELEIGETTWTKHEYNLSDYAGQTIKLAINCVSTDIFGFMFDDIFVGNPEDDTWDYVFTEVTSPYEITGLDPETEYELQVQANCGDEGTSEWSSSTIFTTLPLCEVPTELAVSDITTESAVVTWTSEAESFDIEVNGEVTSDVTSPYTLNDLDPGTIYSVRVRANCGGELGSSDWTTAYTFYTECVAYDLPYEYGFETASDLVCWSMASANTNNSFGVSSYADAYEGNNVFVFSSYNSADAYDQILISPELNTEEAVTVEFYYRSLNGYGSGETFVVGYSTTTNDLTEFVWDEEISTTETEWQKFSATYPAGTKYVAVYYYAYYQYYLLVDGFKFEEAAPQQTFNLTAGWNWISTYIDMNEVDGLRMLEEKLGDYGVSIVTYEGVAEYFGDGYWDGLEDYMWANSEMILVEVNDDCTVTLEGPVVDPTTVEVTINPGWNYIGFPFDTEMAIVDALSPDFEPEFGDGIASKDGLVEYMGDWDGDFDTLIPGQGYMYFNASDLVNTLTFQTSAKIRRGLPAMFTPEKKATDQKKQSVLNIPIINK